MSIKSRFRATWTAFSIGVDITITNPEVLVVIVPMFTFFSLSREEKGPLLMYKTRWVQKAVLLSGMSCVQIINKGSLLIIVNDYTVCVCLRVRVRVFLGVIKCGCEATFLIITQNGQFLKGTWRATPLSLSRELWPPPGLWQNYNCTIGHWNVNAGSLFFCS